MNARPEIVSAAIQQHSSAASSMSKRLLLDGVSKRFGTVTALRQMSLVVEPGALVALLGPSGCGKTTTLRIIAGFEFPDTGMVCIGREDISHLPPNKRGLGMVFQNYGLFPHLNVGENIAFGLRMSGIPKRERADHVKRMLDVIRLPGIADRRISQLSGGQQQRVALARADHEPLGTAARRAARRARQEPARGYAV
ncbi:ABC transporter ATP-binding protein [Bradyrhizobium sp. 200]|uniref:ABC transporter ATP-binding protein n=1 Tax=Bradyrhizobium sp. 200 TaxID=2782665 RepID=UPI001FFF92E8|nr:ABC transporter ATP-binding protein [Bradyrhizobium sp. 200]